MDKYLLFKKKMFRLFLSMKQTNHFKNFAMQNSSVFIFSVFDDRARTVRYNVVATPWRISGSI